MVHTGHRGALARVVLIATAATLLLLGHAFAPTARGECEGSISFSATVPYAHAAIVGTVTTVSRHTDGGVDALGIRVEDRYGVAIGRNYDARFTTAWCADDVRVGSRVVVLLGVHVPSARLDGDLYFVGGSR